MLPLMTLLFLIDLSVGLLGRLNSQLQLIALAFPAKMRGCDGRLELSGVPDSQALPAVRHGSFRRS